MKKVLLSSVAALAVFAAAAPVLAEGGVNGGATILEDLKILTSLQNTMINLNL